MAICAGCGASTAFLYKVVEDIKEVKKGQRTQKVNQYKPGSYCSECATVIKKGGTPKMKPQHNTKRILTTQGEKRR